VYNRGAIPEPITDQANELLNCEVWDPFTLFPPPLQSVIAEPKFLLDEVRIKIRIDDNVNRERLMSAMPLAIHIATRDNNNS